jgi:hypothetical protein
MPIIVEIVKQNVFQTKYVSTAHVYAPTTIMRVELAAQHAQSVNIVTVINAYATTQLIRVDLQVVLVHHAQALPPNASTARVHAPTIISCVDPLVQHVHQVSIVN